MTHKRWERATVLVLLILPWFLLCGFIFVTYQQAFQEGLFAFGPRDVSRRLTAPDSSKTALLERHYGFDLNFRLYIVGNYSAALPNFKAAIWGSKDFDLDTRRSWHEDLEWSADSSIIAVRLEDHYVFAYDFLSKEAIKEPQRIEDMLKSRK
jgi:hypothetical protein